MTKQPNVIIDRLVAQTPRSPLLDNVLYTTLYRGSLYDKETVPLTISPISAYSERNRKISRPKLVEDIAEHFDPRPGPWPV